VVTFFCGVISILPVMYLKVAGDPEDFKAILGRREIGNRQKGYQTGSPFRYTGSIK